eukprot:CAMPEP_0184676888 /NCGR_PEP_ID=MMETSP0308-20130426/88590_1 /TAXON_ID=38269 /ORGANISM="Gloeochaete witrockiana, Strain SAG 46.84" /LENGTH=678 /DNA_ID=CAMNT_0027124749 /DNA_START=126 /DNA_END=2163 /DNA_ORIENTATION=+
MISARFDIKNTKWKKFANLCEEMEQGVRTNTFRGCFRISSRYITLRHDGTVVVITSIADRVVREPSPRSERGRSNKRHSSPDREGRSPPSSRRSRSRSPSPPSKVSHQQQSSAVARTSSLSSAQSSSAVPAAVAQQIPPTPPVVQVKLSEKELELLFADALEYLSRTRRVPFHTSIINEVMQKLDQRYNIGLSKHQKFVPFLLKMANQGLFTMRADKGHHFVDKITKDAVALIRARDKAEVNRQQRRPASEMALLSSAQTTAVPTVDESADLFNDVPLPDPIPHEEPSPSAAKRSPLPLPPVLAAKVRQMQKQLPAQQPTPKPAVGTWIEVAEPPPPVAIEDVDMDVEDQQGIVQKAADRAPEENDNSQEQRGRSGEEQRGGNEDMGHASKRRRVSEMNNNEHMDDIGRKDLKRKSGYDHISYGSEEEGDVRSSVHMSPQVASSGWRSAVGDFDSGQMTTSGYGQTSDWKSATNNRAVSAEDEGLHEESSTRKRGEDVTRVQQRQIGENERGETSQSDLNRYSVHPDRSGDKERPWSASTTTTSDRMQRLVEDNHQLRKTVALLRGENTQLQQQKTPQREVELLRTIVRQLAEVNGVSSLLDQLEELTETVQALKEARASLQEMLVAAERKAAEAAHLAAEKSADLAALKAKYDNVKIQYFSLQDELTKLKEDRSRYR